MTKHILNKKKFKWVKTSCNIKIYIYIYLKIITFCRSSAFMSYMVCCITSRRFVWMIYLSVCLFLFVQLFLKNRNFSEQWLCFFSPPTPPNRKLVLWQNLSQLITPFQPHWPLRALVQSGSEAANLYSDVNWWFDSLKVTKQMEYQEEEYDL